MKIDTIVVLVLTAITVAVLVWIEMKSRRNSAAAPLQEGNPDPIATPTERSKRKR